MRILGIDPGFGRVGIGIIEYIQGKEVYLHSECFETSPKTPFIDRLNLIGGYIENICSRWQPDVVAVETLFFEKNQKTAMHVAEARGVIVYSAQQNGKTRLVEYTPLQIKTALTGYGRADKNQVTFMVQKILTLPEKKRLDDELDALAIAITHISYARPGKATFPLA